MTKHPERRFRPRSSDTAFDVVAIAASLGGLKALDQILPALPADFPVPILVVLHRPPSQPSLIAEILRRRTKVSAEDAKDGRRPRPGTVYFAPPNRHLLIDPDGRFRLSDAPEESYTRPAADPLFLSVAAHYQERAIGVILTGRHRDGAKGVRAIKEKGGRVLVQDPATAEAFGMPRAAIATGCVDFVLPLNIIAPALVTLVMVPGAATLFYVPRR